MRDVLSTGGTISSAEEAMGTGPHLRRLRIGFFDFADVFADFNQDYGVSQEAFATTWAATGDHARVSLIQLLRLVEISQIGLPCRV